MFGQFGLGGFGKADLILVNAAERNDARQDRGLKAELFEEDIAGSAAGALRRQIKSGAGDLQRIARGRIAFHQPAREHRVDQYLKKGRRCGDGEEVGLHTVSLHEVMVGSPVIPGRERQRANPESILRSIRRYGFRARGLRPRPGMTRK